MDAFEHLYNTVLQYHVLSEQSWQAYKSCCRPKTLVKGEILYDVGVQPTSFCFLHKGLMRAYLIDEKGNEYNKNFFCEGRFPGSMTALLKQEPSMLGVEALEDCDIIDIDFAAYRQLLVSDPGIMRYHISYLETHWLLEKEQKELNYLQYDAKDRYLDFNRKYASILHRLPQYHIASYLGITPTQLSRIRKEL